MCLYYGLASKQVPVPEHTTDLLNIASKLAVERGLAKPGDRLIVLSGRPLGNPGATNTLVIHTIEK